MEKKHLYKEQKSHIRKKSNASRLLKKTLDSGGLDYTDKKSVLACYTNVNRQIKQLKKTMNR